MEPDYSKSLFDTQPLIKTDYILWCDCPHNAWLKRNRPDIYNECAGEGLSDFERSLVETGNLVEHHARDRYKGGFLVTGREATAVWQTDQALKRGETTIYQATFTDTVLFAAVDILLRNAATGAFSVLEVKATTEAKQPKTNKAKLFDDPYVQDLAFQVRLLQRMGHVVERAAIVRLNPDYRRGETLDVGQLFVEDDLTDFLEETAGLMDERLADAVRFMTSPEHPPAPCKCLYRGRSKHCTTFPHTNPDHAGYGIHDITFIGAHAGNLRDLVASGYKSITDVPADYDWPRDSQRLQAYVTESGVTHIDRQAIGEALSNLVYPIHFLDYETFAPAVPRFAGYKPFQQMPFQYSLHIQHAPGAEPEHHEFLYLGQEDPAPHLFAQLQKDMQPTGSVVVWSAAMERSSVNGKQAERLPEFRAFLEDMNARMFDLRDVFAKQMHVMPEYLGKTSIKYVLPALVGWSYQDLEIGNGGEAMNTWNRVVTEGVSDQELAEIRRQMLTYCELDTKAMWGILCKLENCVEAPSYTPNPVDASVGQEAAL